MVLAVHPSVADQTIGVVVAVQALKLKFGYHGHWCNRALCVHVGMTLYDCVVGGVGVCIL